MRILHSELAQKGDTFVKGDRVAVDAERGKGHHSTKSWWTGTVVRLEGTKIEIRHDDDGESDSYPFSRSQTDHFIKLPRSTKIIKRDLTAKEVKLLLPPEVPKSKPTVLSPKPKTVRPAVTPRAEDPELFFWMISDAHKGDELSETVTEAQYRASPWLGAKRRTGRAASTTAYSIPVGISQFERRFCAVSVPTGKTTLLFSRTSVYPYDGPKTNKEQVVPGASQMPYREWCDLRSRARQFLEQQEKKRLDHSTDSRDVAIRLGPKMQVGKQVLIKFANGPAWKTIQALDHRKDAVGISGSGTKLRWIPFSYVADVRETPN